MAKKNKELVVEAVSKFDGRLLPLWGTYLLQILALGVMAGIGAAIAIVLEFNLIGIVALCVFAGIGYCWACIIGSKWWTKHTVISGQRMKFKASALNLFFNIIKWTFLTVITVGIYSLWMPIKVQKWATKHTVSSPEEDEYGYAAPQITYYEYE